MAAIIIVALIHVAIGYALITGLAISAVKEVVQRVTTVDIEEPEPPEEPEEEPPPPPEPETAPPPPVAPPPPIRIAPAPPPIRTQTNIPPPAPVAIRVPPPAPAAPPPAPPPPPPPPSQARGVERDGYARWAARIVNDGYPSRAISRGIEGVVGVSVVVGTNGRVESCSVTRSSGESGLDSGACDAMGRYARYNPALNDAGQPISGRDTLSIDFRLN